MAIVGQGTELVGGAAFEKRGDERKIPPSLAACGTRVVPEWVKDLRPEGTAGEEARRLGPDVRGHSVSYWRMRLRMFPPRSIFGDPVRWGALKDAIEDQLSPWEPKPFSVLFADLRDDYGAIAEQVLRQALRLLVEDGVLTFVSQNQREDDFGGYSRQMRPIRRTLTDLDWDVNDVVTPQIAKLAAKRACR